MNKLMISAALAGYLAAFATAAIAQDAAAPAASAAIPAATATSPAPAAAPAAPIDPDDVVYCRDMEVTGSYIPKHVCLTRRQWRKMNHNSQDMVDQWQSRSGGGVSGH